MITPTSNRILVKLASAGEKLEGGIYIPTSAQGEPQEGVVLNVGPKVTEITEGDRVVISKYGATEIEKGIVLVTEDEVLGILPTTWATPPAE